MQYKFYIHGVPKGFVYIGPAEEKDSFLKRYYDGKRNINEFRIEARNVKGKTFYYYSYIVGKNVRNKDGRPESYLGITVRLDRYYKRALNLRYLLDSIFYSFIYNKVYESKGNVLQFRIDVIETRSPEFLELKEGVKRLIEITFAEEDLLDLTSIQNSSNYAKISMADATDSYVRDMILKFGAVSISNEYPSKAVKEITEKKDKEISEISKRMSSLKEVYDSDMAKLKKQKKESENVLNEKLNELKKENIGLQEILNKVNKNLDEIKGIIGNNCKNSGGSSIKKPEVPQTTTNDDNFKLWQFNNAGNKQNGSSLGKKKFATKKGKKWLGFIILIVALFILFIIGKLQGMDI